jgi:type VI secretion system protein ImpC
MSESTQHKLSRVRAPRVQITYDVETGGAQSRREIAYVVGVLAPLAGESEKVAARLSDRKMVTIDRDNFDSVLASIEPRLSFSVPKTTDGSNGSLGVELVFQCFDDFEPISLVRQVPEMQDLYLQRGRLRDFLAKLDGNDGLVELVEAILGDKKRRDALKDIFVAAKDAISEAQKLDDAAERSEAVNSAIDKKSRAKGSDLELLLESGKMVLEESQVPYAIELLAEFFAQFVESGVISVSSSDDLPNLGGLVSGRVAMLDGAVSRQLNYIIHHENFQALEASWRGLNYLVMNTETGASLKIKVLNATFEELYKDLDKAVEFDQSTLFKIIYENEYGTFGGEPFSVLIGDYQIGRSPRDITFAEKMGNIAAAAHAPFISSAYSKLFDMEDFDELHKPRDLTKLFESAELIKWRAFRETEDSRYVTLTLPKVLLRLPYHHENNPAEGVYFDEDVAVTIYELDDKGEVVKDKAGNPIVITAEDANGIEFEKTKKEVDARKMLWGNPAYILGRVITRAFELYGWTAAIKGVDGGGLVESLPAYTYETEDGDIKLNCPTQVSITDRREKELNDLGFMAICHCKGSDKAAFFGGQTTNKARQYLTDSANANAQVSSMLPYMLASSRFAHYIKVMMRERVGSFMSRQQVSDYLNNWLSQYVLLDDGAPQALKARYPLREARVDVTEVEGKVGSFRATVFLRPHFQLEELTASIRMVADLPS